MEKSAPIHFKQEWQIAESSESSLEQRLIEKYLADKGHTLLDLGNLPQAQAKHLMAEACQQASLKLTEIESKANVWADVEA